MTPAHRRLIEGVIQVDAAESHPGAAHPTSIVPQLAVRRGRAAVEFYKQAFGAAEVYRVGGTEDHEEVVAQLSIGTASFCVSDESPPNHTFSPESLGGGTVRMLLIEDDPTLAVERAVTAGATEISPVARGARMAIGEDRGSVRPPLGDRHAARPVATSSAGSDRPVNESTRTGALMTKCRTARPSARSVSRPAAPGTHRR